MSYYEPSWDDEGNPEVGTWVKEEPDCMACCDQGYVLMDNEDRIIEAHVAPVWSSPIRKEGCPDCNPSPEMQAKIEAQIAEQEAIIGRMWAGSALLTDEPPF